MNYPVWEVPYLGGGLIIALIAIPHIFVSHFAIGGGMFLAYSERIALRDGNSRLLEFLKRNTLFFVLITLVFGAVGGVGIWFSIALVHPPATSILIHKFVFLWAIEWVFFLIEIAAALVYYYSWDRVGARTHNTIGWIYAISAWLSLFVINGILTFMLTPGGWPDNPSLLAAFFNPGYLPSLFVRTFVCIALAGLYTLFMASREPPGEGHDMLVRYTSKWLIPAFIGLPISGLWYVSTLPTMAREMLYGGVPSITMFAVMSVAISVVLFAFAYLIANRNPQSVNPTVAVVFMVLGLAVTGASERVREAVRRPYIIHGYMYSNATLPTQIDDLRQSGVLVEAKWASTDRATDGNALDAGRQVFTTLCAHCHTIDGYRGIRSLTHGWTQAFTSRAIANLDALKGYMPPFAGNQTEREALAWWIVSLDDEVRGQIDAGTVTVTLGGAGGADIVEGEDLWEDYCGACHSLDPDEDNPILPKIAGKSADELNDVIDTLEDLEGFMPPFDGSDQERERLAAWLAAFSARSAGGAQ